MPKEKKEANIRANHRNERLPDFNFAFFPLLPHHLDFNGLWSICFHLQGAILYFSCTFQKIRKRRIILCTELVSLLHSVTCFSYSMIVIIHAFQCIPYTCIKLVLKACRYLLSLTLCRYLLL